MEIGGATTKCSRWDLAVIGSVFVWFFLIKFALVVAAVLLRGDFVEFRHDMGHD